MESNNNNLRDASFSSYLNSTEETFVRKLAESNRSLQSPMINPQEELIDSLARKKEEEAEIGVFGAEKYFNGQIDEDSPRINGKIDPKMFQYKDDQSVNPGPVTPKIQPGTPSVRSESSSNSQSALLQSVLRNPSRRKPNKANGKSFLANFGCKCSCYDKNSVDIDDHVGEISFNINANSGVVQGKAIKNTHTKADPREKEDLGLNRENCFTFPTMNSEVGNLNLPVKTKFQEEEEKIPRKSLEIFGSPILEKRNRSLSLERRLTMLPWDVEEHKFSMAPGAANYNDTESDASSDLFEIESLTGKANPFLARQASDAASGCVTPTTCYAPSEASIEWSVVTASAADFSVISDCEELRPATATTSPVRNLSTNPNAKTGANKEIQRRLPSSLLGCKSQKAVRVAGDAYITNQKTSYDPRIRCISEPFTAVTRFQAETKFSGFESRNRLSTHSQLPRSHSPRASHLLFIQ